MTNTSLFDFGESLLSSSTLKIVLPENLKEKWDEIFEDEYNKVTSKVSFNMKIDKDSLKKNALANFRSQMSLISITGTFHLDNKELFISGSKNIIRDGKVTFQKEMMILEECDVEKMETVVINNIYTLMRTATFCTVLGG